MEDMAGRLRRRRAGGGIDGHAADRIAHDVRRLAACFGMVGVVGVSVVVVHLELPVFRVFDRM